MDYMQYMDIALEEARAGYRQGEIPVGAVLVCNDRVVARDHNRKEQYADPTAHAEILVIQKAASVLGRWRLTGCQLFVTLEPCPMCVSAVCQARIDRLVYGVMEKKTGAVESTINLLKHSSCHYNVEVVAGIREEECQYWLQKGFDRIRRETEEKK